MKIKMIIDTHKEGEDGNHRSVVWEGELEILDRQEYLMMVSVMAEGEMQPIVQIPFAKGLGHYLWVPPDPTEAPIEIWRDGQWQTEHSITDEEQNKKNLENYWKGQK